MIRVVAVEPRANFQVWVRFEDGVTGVADLSDMVGSGVFAAWDDPLHFASVSIDPETHTLVWPGGIDLCPDSLYDELVNTQQPGETPRIA
jgi:hypothetical protein